MRCFGSSLSSWCRKREGNVNVSREAEHEFIEDLAVRDTKFAIDFEVRYVVVNLTIFCTANRFCCNSTSVLMVLDNEDWLGCLLVASGTSSKVATAGTLA